MKKRFTQPQQTQPPVAHDVINTPAIPLVRDLPPIVQQLTQFGELAAKIEARRDELRAEASVLRKTTQGFRKKELGLYFDQGCDLIQLREAYAQLGLWTQWQKAAGLDDESVHRWIHLAECAVKEYGNRDDARKRLCERFPNFTRACQHYGIPTGGNSADAEQKIHRSAVQLEKLELTETQRANKAQLKSDLENVVKHANRLLRQVID